MQRAPLMELNRPPLPTEKKTSGWGAFISAVMFLTVAAAVLYVAPLGKFGQFILLGAVVFTAVLGLHYFVWGWWLPKVIEREQREAESENESDSG